MALQSNIFLYYVRGIFCENPLIPVTTCVYSETVGEETMVGKNGTVLVRMHRDPTDQEWHIKWKTEEIDLGPLKEFLNIRVVKTHPYDPIFIYPEFPRLTSCRQKFNTS